jgi:hypothetical protein
MIKPDFFIVGAPKCGTTALAEYLREHRNIFMSWPKEPHFFAHDFPMYKEHLPCIDNYLDLFRDADKSQHIAVGEASVYYLYSRKAIPAIHEFNRDARLIVMLRNPVDIVASMHSQLLWTLDEDEKDLETAWRYQAKRLNGKNIPARCREPALLQYGELASIGAQVQRMLSIFPRDQIKFVRFEDFKNNTQQIYSSVLAFLEVPDNHRTHFPVINGNRCHKNPLISRFTQRPPRHLVLVANSLKKSIGIKRLGIMKKIRSFSNETKPRPSISVKFRNELSDYFKNDVEKLSSLLDWDIDHWIEPEAGNRRANI